MSGRIHSLESFGTVDGPGTRFVVFVQGCPMRCKYCHNPDTWDLHGGTVMEADEIMEQYTRNAPFYQNGGGITVTGGEPLMQMDFLYELFSKAKAQKVHTCIDSSGIAFQPMHPEWMEKLDRVLELTDLVMLDIKHIDPDKHKELTNQNNKYILEFAEYLSQKGIEIWIRHVVVPGITDEEEYLFKLGYFIGGLRTLKALDLLPYHTMGVKKYEAIGLEYPLEGVEPMEKSKMPAIKEIVLNGIRKRRAEIKEQEN